MRALIAAGVVAVVALGSAYAIPRRLRPQVLVRLLTGFACFAALAAMWAITLVAGANVAQMHGIAERLSACNELLTSHRDSLAPAGYATLALLCAAVLSATRARLRQRRARAPRDAPTLAVTPDDDAVAFALPGRPGQIVLSSGLLRRLAPAERRVVVAHESAHLEFRHHRYVRLTQLAAALLPFLSPITHRVRFATERWADEVTAHELGDRELVATAVAHAALLQPIAAGQLGIASGTVVERVKALRQPPPARQPRVEAALVALLTGAAVLLLLSVIDVHHWFVALLGFC